MKGKLHTIPSAHIFSEGDDTTKLETFLGIADVLDSRWGVGKFQGIFDTLTKKPAYGKVDFPDASYIGEFDDNADFSGQGVIMLGGGAGFISGNFINGSFQSGVIHFVESKMTAIVREYLDDGSWFGTVFYDEDEGWAYGVFGEDWTLLEGDEFDSEGNEVRSVERESDDPWNV